MFDPYADLGVINESPEERRRRLMLGSNPYAAPSTGVFNPNAQPVPPLTMPPTQQPPAAVPPAAQPPTKTAGQNIKANLGGALAQFGQNLANAPVMTLDPNLGHAPMPTQFQRPQMPQLPMLRYGGNFGGYREKGGPVYPGKRYRVGEKGPEDLTIYPDGTGNVTPLVQSQGQQLQPLVPDYDKNRSVTGNPFAGPSANPNTPPLTQPEDSGTLSPNDDIIGARNKMTPTLKKSPGLTQDEQLSDADISRMNLEKQKADLIARGEKHVSKGASALSYIFQGMREFGDRMEGRKLEPIVPLGQQRFANEQAKIDRKLIPLYEQREATDKSAKTRAEAARATAEANAATAKANRDAQDPALKYDWRKGEDGKWYIAPKGTTDYKAIDSIPGTKKVTVKVPGTNDYVDIPETQYYHDATTIEAANIGKQAAAANKNNELPEKNAKVRRDFHEDDNKWYTSVTQKVTDGNSKYNQGGDLLGEADDLDARAQKIRSDAQGNLLIDPKEADKLEAEARDKRTKGKALQEEGKALINQAAASKRPNPKDYVETQPYTAPQQKPPRTVPRIPKKGSTVSSAQVDNMVAIDAEDAKKENRTPRTREQVIKELQAKGYNVK